MTHPTKDERAQLLAMNSELRDCLSEAVDLMNDTREGAYKPDSFTTQPWERALALSPTDPGPLLAREKRAEAKGMRMAAAIVGKTGAGCACEGRDLECCGDNPHDLKNGILAEAERIERGK